MSDKAFAFDFYSIACDERTDATDNTQLFIFCGELMLTFALRKSEPTCKDIFEAVSNAIDKVGPKWD